VDDFPELTIGQVADRAGIAPSAIRYYESLGLLPEPDRLGGQRRYDERAVGRLAFIAVAQNAGFKLREIGELIDGIDASGGMAGSMRALSDRKLPEVELLLQRTQAMKGWLEVARECGCSSPDECGLFPDEATGGSEPLSVVKVERGDCRR
jgi:MerR family transcriptional regulator, redox-sensitive transcriptional activator SoxR